MTEGKHIELEIKPQDVSAYPFLVGSGVIEELPTRLPGHHHAVVIIADEKVFDLWGEVLLPYLEGVRLEILKFPGGETSKTREEKRRLEDIMLGLGLGRDTVIVSFGGGVTSDLAGFLAATYMRGISFVNVATTLLSMVDATVGGKTGVNTSHGKNLLGAFHHPSACFADCRFLKTLPSEELKSGLAEMVKHGVVADGQYFNWLVEKGPEILKVEQDILPYAIARSVEIKAKIVSADTKETGQRKVLNFGHTIGHALEKLSGFRLGHGQAVAVGMSLEAKIAKSMGVMCDEDCDRLISSLKELGLIPTIPSLSPRDFVLAMRGDKKKARDRVKMALPARIGKMEEASGQYSLDVPDALIEQILQKELNSGFFCFAQSD